MVAQPLPPYESSDETRDSGVKPPRRFYRSRRDRMLAGVAGGLAQYFGMDPVLVRLAFVLLAATTGFGLLAYIVLAVVTPEIPSGTPEPVVPGITLETRRGRDIVAFGLITVGIVWLASNMGWLTFMHWGQMWPIALVLIGVWLIVGRRADSAE